VFANEYRGPASLFDKGRGDTSDGTGPYDRYLGIFGEHEISSRIGFDFSPTNFVVAELEFLISIAFKLHWQYLILFALYDAMETETGE
jgi:hypothetical protein